MAADQLAEEALLEAEIGETTRARQTAEEAVATFPGRDVRVMAAWALARSGEISRAEELTKTISKEFQSDGFVRTYSLPTMQAATEFRTNPNRAIDLLRVTMPYDLGHAPGSLPNLYHIYLRGLAYVQMGEPKQAALEFQKIIDHPGVVYYFIIGALAHLRLGRAQVMMGDKMAARKSYDDFLTLWKDADPDIPIYKQAKAEYARLR
jgi:tetratricopeptide (TPR) repeat protein